MHAEQQTVEMSAVFWQFDTKPDYGQLSSWWIQHTLNPTVEGGGEIGDVKALPVRSIATQISGLMVQHMPTLPGTSLSMWENLTSHEVWGGFVSTYCHDDGEPIWDGSTRMPESSVMSSCRLREDISEVNTEWEPVKCGIFSCMFGGLSRAPVCVDISTSPSQHSDARCGLLFFFSFFFAGSHSDPPGTSHCFSPKNHGFLFKRQHAVYTGRANWIHDCRPLVYFN